LIELQWRRSVQIQFFNLPAGKGRFGFYYGVDYVIDYVTLYLNKFISVLMKNISMNINYQLSSAEEEVYELTEEMKTILDEQLEEDDVKYLTAEQSINLLKAKNGLQNDKKSFNTKK
jgi:hypothetical protein